MMRLKVNGVEEETGASTLGELLAARGIDPRVRFLAIAVNGAVIRRAEWAGAPLSTGDEVEIVRPVQGG
jgi:sulfur carrier protein